MTMLEKVETEIKKLSHGDFVKLLEWIDHYREDEWDRQMDRDSISSRLNFLFEEAGNERTQGKLKDWPPSNR